MDPHKQEPRSLIMCTTPLQMLIAEKIIGLNKNKKFDFLLIVNGHMNDKFLYYYEKLKKICINSMYYVIGENTKLSKFYRFINFKKVFLSFTWVNYNNYYLASIDSKYLQWIILKKNCSSLIHTFDDGFANISTNSTYYKGDNRYIFKTYIWKVLGVNCSINKIKENIFIHYTIYEDLGNIVENTKFIQLFEKNNNNNNNNNNNKKVVNLFLGQPMYEINNMYTQDFICKIIDKININIYFPHPRENYNIKINAEIINTNLIFEDYILHLVENNFFVNVYTFISTAGLNIIGIENTNVYYLYDSYLKKEYAEFYNMLENKNIILVSVD